MQAQGGALEASESWAQDEPMTNKECTFVEKETNDIRVNIKVLAGKALFVWFWF